MTNIHDQAARSFRIYLAEGQALFPDARPSHLCLRTATPEEYAVFHMASKLIGTVRERSHGGRPITWVSLDEPIVHDQAHLKWLEITHPKPDDAYATGPQMLVFHDESLEDPVKHLSLADPAFAFRCQRISAAQLANRLG